MASGMIELFIAVAEAGLLVAFLTPMLSDFIRLMCDEDDEKK